MRNLSMTKPMRAGGVTHYCVIVNEVFTYIKGKHDELGSHPSRGNDRMVGKQQCGHCHDCVASERMLASLPKYIGKKKKREWNIKYYQNNIKINICDRGMRNFWKLSPLMTLHMPMTFRPLPGLLSFESIYSAAINNKSLIMAFSRLLYQCGESIVWRSWNLCVLRGILTWITWVWKWNQIKSASNNNQI